MGCIDFYRSYIAQRDVKAKSNKIDKRIRMSKKDFCYNTICTFNFLYFGKSWYGQVHIFVKQLEILRGYRYNEKERSGYKLTIFSCILHSMRRNFARKEATRRNISERR